MLFNYLLGIYCFYCNRYIDPYQVLLDVLYEGSISCDKDHLIGNQSDPQWQEYFYNYACPYYYLYHHVGQCRCVQEETNCEGLSYQCKNHYGKKAYEDDLKE
jgi:hypothetical protein